MRYWLFFKKKPAIDGKVKVEFQQLREGRLINVVPSKLANGLTFDEGDDIDKLSKAAARQAGWRNGEAESADSPVGQAMLKGHWL